MMFNDFVKKAWENQRKREREDADRRHEIAQMEGYRMACAGWVLVADRMGADVPRDAVSWAKDVWRASDCTTTVSETLFRVIEEEVNYIP